MENNKTENKAKYDLFDTVITCAWLAMDIFWMEEFLIISRIVGIFLIAISILRILYSSKDRREWINALAVHSWVMMNYMWMIESDNKFWLAVSIVMAVFAIRENHKFKRFNI